MYALRLWFRWLLLKCDLVHKMKAVDKKGHKDPRSSTTLELTLLCVREDEVWGSFCFTRVLLACTGHKQRLCSSNGLAVPMHVFTLSETENTLTTPTIAKAIIQYITAMLGLGALTELLRSGGSSRHSKSLLQVGVQIIALVMVVMRISPMAWNPRIRQRAGR